MAGPIALKAEDLGLRAALVVIDGEIYNVTGTVILPTLEHPIIDTIIENLMPGAEVYANLACYRMGIPLRSQ